MRYLHTMLRVADPEAAVRFYTLLGLRETRRMENQAGRYTLIYLAADEDFRGELVQASIGRLGPALRRGRHPLRQFDRLGRAVRYPRQRRP